MVQILIIRSERTIVSYSVNKLKITVEYYRCIIGDSLFFFLLIVCCTTDRILILLFLLSNENTFSNNNSEIEKYTYGNNSVVRTTNYYSVRANAELFQNIKSVSKLLRNFRS